MADSGIEYAYWKIRDYRWNEADGNHVLESTDDLDDVFGGTDCVVESGNAVVNGSVNGGTYKLYFYRNPSNTTMNTCTDANSTIERITKIKSVGTYNGITRSVEADVTMSGL
ncbi:MAG: hypothetical protein UR65_C0073G0005 [Candidatus Moranbacteria bacterium GW2011_GWE2_35_164]|nr:MAG: hypothetical protein UR65_C0073G0005 [Candidatus Moranbacteria bacterium GW2011_GWE2_35_164]